MSRRLIWIFFSLIAFAILIPVSISINGDWQVYSKGTIVKVELKSLPRTTSGFIKFKMDGRIYNKRLSGNVTNSLNVGDSIQLKYLKGYEGHFLFPDENPVTWSIIAILLFPALGIACLYYAFKRDPPPIQVFGKTLR